MAIVVLDPVSGKPVIIHLPPPGDDKHASHPAPTSPALD